MTGWTAADDIRARLTPDHYEYAMSIMRALDEVEFKTDSDTAVVVWLKGFRGEPQPVIWPMRTHVHNADCNRA